MSYLLCCALLLYRRIRGDIKAYDELREERISPSNLSWGPWRVPGILGTANNIFACLYLALIWIFSFWPPSSSVTPDTMNYASLVFGSILVFSLVWYLLVARKTFLGPVIEV